MINDTLQAQALSEWRDEATGLWTYINEAVGKHPTLASSSNLQLTSPEAYPNIQDIMGTAASTWLSSVSSGLSSALSSLSASTDSTVLKGITAQFNTQLSMLQDGEGQLEIIMTMLSGAGSAGIQVAQQHAWSRGQVMIQSADAFVPPTINPVSGPECVEFEFGLISLVWCVELFVEWVGWYVCFPSLFYGAVLMAFMVL